MEFYAQIERIKEKLSKAQEADKNFKVFGAERHKYQVNKPATLDEVVNFEQQFSIVLPDCYRTFILQIGNGGIGYSNSAAGPFYGIFPLGKEVNELIFDNVEQYLKNDCLIYPQMTDEYWKLLCKNLNDNEDISDDEYESEIGKLFGGILPIGSQGCSYLHGIILNGEFKGRVVNLDMDRQKPYFAFEKNFLDWYERWLDEIIDGTLLQEGPLWFGYNIGGSIDELLEKYKNEDNEDDKNKILTAILGKAIISQNQLSIIESEFIANRTNLLLLQILTKFNYDSAKQFLYELAESDLKNTFKIIRTYAITKGLDWMPFIKDNILKISDDDTYIDIRNILEKTQIDFGNIILPLMQSEDENIRASVINTLGCLKEKNNYISVFKIGLQDKSNTVVRHSVGALYESKDKELLPYYKEIIENLPIEKNQIETIIYNDIVSNLKLFNLSTEDLFKDDNRKKWYRFWK